jgi:cytochrome c oxidase cbb3-type subunit 4
MFKNYFKGIEGIANYPMVSLLVFFIFFIVITVWWIRADKKQLKELSEIPLGKSEQDIEKL